MFSVRFFGSWLADVTVTGIDRKGSKRTENRKGKGKREEKNRQNKEK
jgi:hypothetical protein